MTVLIPIDWDLVKKRLIEGCSARSIAMELGFASSNALHRCEKELGIPYRDFINQYSTRGDNMLRGAQMKKALSGDTQMLIFLGKNRLKQTEREHHKMEADKKILHFLAAIKEIDAEAFDRAKVSKPDDDDESDFE